MEKFHRSITVGRAQNFVSPHQFSDVNLKSRLYYDTVTAQDGDGAFVKLSVFSVPDLKRIPFSDATSLDKVYKPTSTGEAFGPTWSTHWFRVQLTIPPNWTGREVHFVWDAGNEGLIFSEDGLPLQGLTGGGSGAIRKEYVLSRHASGGSTYRFYLEMSCNGLFGAGKNGLINPPDMNQYYVLKTAELSSARTVAWNLLWDFEVILGIANSLPADSQQACDALMAANAIVNAYRHDDPDGGVESMENCRKIAAAYLSGKNGSRQHRIIAVGNCHIDTAWLWPFDETKRKVARSWASQISLMERYPEYIFAASQMQQFEWLEEGHPGLMQRLKEKVKTGQFVPIGGTWVENDCNIPSGEALCRQFLYGQQSLKRLFGKHSTIFWLPDTFGYSAQLPQVVHEAGAKYFFTQKLSWNNINKFPHTSFYWIGLDGTRCLTHMAPAETYTAGAEVAEIVKSCKDNRDKYYSRDSLLLYGHGDGGGGPTMHMIERLRRMSDVDGLPRVALSTPEQFYEQLERESPNLVSWKGELYFELHRGTYTTHAEVKKSNRKSELLLRDVEIVSTIATRLSSKLQYPKDTIDKLWKNTLLNQFHDVLPGTCIEIVYHDVRELYRQILDEGNALREKALRFLAEGGCDGTTSGTRKHASATGGSAESDDYEDADGFVVTRISNTSAAGFVVCNTLPWKRNAVISIPAGVNASLTDMEARCNESDFVLLTDIEGMSVFSLESRQQKKPNDGARVVQSGSGTFVLENEYLKAALDMHGRLRSLIYKADSREMIVQGLYGNRLIIYEDIPLNWDAWDVEVYHLEKFRETDVGAAKILHNGPVRAAVIVEGRLTPTSTYTQVISLDTCAKVLEFTCTVDWNENRQFLKVEFPFDIMNDTATYETQFGHVGRPTHFNTTWDVAKFEVCGHKWADISEHAGHGVALLNDCKYGYATHGNVMRLSLIRSPKAPDAHADIGVHTFRYGVYPHAGTFYDADVVRVAYEFNVSLVTARGVCGSAASGKPYFSVEGSKNVILDTVKKAEDSDAVVVRLYEAYGGNSTVTLRSMLPFKKATRCNILEQDSETVAHICVGDGSFCVTLAFRPFQIITLKLH